ncbi:MAG: hypothetical protein IKP78_00450 [Ruminococcus sp.]|nr:hypothetical protein [Ruminococcus sp.]
MEDLYINRCKAFIDFMLSQQQWSGLTKSNIDSWLNNFKDLNVSEQELIYKLLTNIIYFSENDVTETLKEGVFNCLSYNEILKEQINSGFSVTEHNLQYTHRKRINESCFVPLLDKDAPHESGNNICRILVQQGIVPQDRSVFIHKVPKLLVDNQIKRIIIVDDCVGSGDQLRSFWEETKIEDNDATLSIKELCQKHGIQAYYLTLFGYNKSIDRLKKEFPDLIIHCVRELNDKHKVFSDYSYIWKDKSERDEAFNLIDSLAKNAEIPTYGYACLDFAFIMHKTIPDWSLPIFWMESSEWICLLRRKNSNG